MAAILNENAKESDSKWFGVANGIVNHNSYSFEMTSSSSSLIGDTSIRTPYDASCESSFSNDYHVMLSTKIFFVASIIFVIIGLVGNALSMAVFSSRDMQTVSSNVYLLALAVSDSLYLITIFLSKLLTIVRCWYYPDTPSLDLTNHSTFTCAALQYLSDLLSDYSTCLILAFTVERSVAVFLPIRFRDLCTVWRARITCTAIFVLIAGSIAPYHFLCMGLYPEYNVCSVLPEYENSFSIFYVIELVSLRVIPVIIIALLNAFIIVRITALTRVKAKRRATHLQLVERKPAVPGGAGERGMADGINHDDERRRSEVRRESRKMSSAPPMRVKHEDRSLQLTVILVLVSSTYIIVYIPVLVDFCLRKLKVSEVIDPTKETMSIISNWTKALYVSGFAINFFLYTLSGRVFRDQLNHILCQARRWSGGGGGVGGTAAETTASGVVMHGQRTQATIAAPAPEPASG